MYRVSTISVKLSHGHLPVSRNSCFNSSESLESITFGNGLAYIGDNSFSNNRLLKELNFPESLRNYGKNCFNNNESLRKVSFPRWQYYYNYLEDCFNNCPAIEEIFCESRPPKPFKNCFDKVDKNKCCVIVPDGTSAKYKACSGWQDFNIIEKSDYTSKVTDIPADERNKEEKFYSLSGIHVDSSEQQSGSIYIRKKGNETQKIMK